MRGRELTMETPCKTAPVWAARTDGRPRSLASARNLWLVQEGLSVMYITKTA
jgi:hypothetical protein